MDSVNSPIIVRPTSLSELQNAIIAHPDAFYWAGGTNIMMWKNVYPSTEVGRVAIYTKDVAELKRFQRNDRYAEFGSAVTLHEIYAAGKSVLPKLLVYNLRNAGERLITRRATIGGAIMARNPSTSFLGTLAALNVAVEVRYPKKNRVHSKWFQLVQILNPDGYVELPKGGLISRVRISFFERNFHNFITKGDFCRRPDESVSMCFVANMDGDVPIDASFALAFPDRGVFVSRDVNKLITTQKFPLFGAQLNLFVRNVLSSIPFEISKLQKIRTAGAIRELVDSINSLKHPQTL